MEGKGSDDRRLPFVEQLTAYAIARRLVGEGYLDEQFAPIHSLDFGARFNCRASRLKAVASCSV